MHEDPDVPARQVGESGRDPLSQVLYRYIEPSRMVSPDMVGDALPPPEEGAASGKSMVGDRVDDMVALAYVSKIGLLSDPSRRPAETAAGGPGFLVEEPLVGDEELVATLTGPSRDDPDMLQRALFLMREGELLMREGRYDRAEELFARILQSYPELVYANQQLGRISLRKGRYDLAIGYFTAALNTEEPLAETLNELGIAYLYAGRGEEALSRFEAALSADPSFREPRYNAGLALRRLARFDEARAAITDFLEDRPDDPRAYRELAMIDLETGQADAALAMLERAMAVDQAWSMPWLDAAVLRVDRGEYVEAIALLQGALERTSAFQVFQVYNDKRLHELRLIPESRAFESNLVAKMRRRL